MDQNWNSGQYHRLVAPIVLGCAVLLPAAAVGQPDIPRPEPRPGHTVRALGIDGTAVIGEWVGSTDQHSVAVRTADGIRTVPLDDLIGLTFDRPAEKSAPQDAKSVEPALLSGVGFHLADGGFIPGVIVGEAAGAVVGRCLLGDSVVMPFERLAGIQLTDAKAYPRAAELFRETLSDRLPGHDVLVTRSKDDAKSLRGTLEQLGPQRGSFALAGGSARATVPAFAHATAQPVRTFRLEKIFGIVFAAGAYKQPTYPITVELVDGSVFSGKIRSADAETLRIGTSLDVDADVAITTVAEIRCRSHRVVYLSDLTPKTERIEGRLHRPWPLKQDRSVGGGPLTIGGRRFEKGLGVHSRTELDYELAGGYETFVATLGIDDAVRPRGSVVFRVLGDGTVLHESATLTGTSEPQPCRVDVDGVALLTLVVDYGDALDLADHADWGGARLLRAADAGSR